MTVTLTAVEPADRPFVCIRGNELELELLAPLDRPMTPPPRSPPVVEAPPVTSAPSETPWTAPLSPAELRARIAAAARARAQAQAQANAS